MNNNHLWNVLAAITITLGVGGLALVNRPSAPVKNEPPPAPTTISQTNIDTGSNIACTIKHDDHWFVVIRTTGMLHHPSCPCLKNQPR